MNAHKEKSLSHDMILKMKSGHNIAIISDAGTPGISDPGAFSISELRVNITLWILPP